MDGKAWDYMSRLFMTVTSDGFELHLNHKQKRNKDLLLQQNFAQKPEKIE